MAVISKKTDPDKMKQETKSFVGKVKYGLFPMLIVSACAAACAAIVGVFWLLFYASPLVGGLTLGLFLLVGLIILVGHLRQDIAIEQLRRGREVKWNQINNSRD